MRREVLEAAASGAWEALRAFRRAKGESVAPHWEQLLIAEKEEWFTPVRLVAEGANARAVHENWKEKQCSWEELPPVDQRTVELVVDTMRAVLRAFPISHLTEPSPGLKGQGRPGVPPRASSAIGRSGSIIAAAARGRPSPGRSAR